MQKKLESQPLSEIAKYLQTLFEHEKYILCAYGSHVYFGKEKKSDIDLFVATQDHNEVYFQKVKNCVVSVHTKYGLKFDEEVPYENKLLVTYSDLDAAIKLEGLECHSGVYSVPKVKKTKAFLLSREVKLRLLFNALTSPHIACGNDSEFYLTCRNKAERHLILLAFSLVDSTKMKLSEFISVLLSSTDGEFGELYLGYKDLDPVTSYLNDIFHRANLLFDETEIETVKNDSLIRKLTKD